jgi:hypothetical protein
LDEAFNFKKNRRYEIQYSTTEQTFDEMLLSAKQVKEIRKKDALRDIPIIVLTADHKGSKIYEGEGKDWIKYQNDIASLSNKSKHIFVKNCKRHKNKPAGAKPDAFLEAHLPLI